MANQATLLIKIFGPFAEMANFFNQTYKNIDSPLAIGDKNISAKRSAHYLIQMEAPRTVFFSIMNTQKTAPSNFGFQAC